jgi:methyl-accepting chemotaxis protein PixJ
METNVIGLAEQLQDFINNRYSNLVALARQDIFTLPQISSLTTTETRNQALKRFREVHPYFDSLVLFDLQGNPIAQTSSTKINRQENEEYFQTVLNTKRSYISEPQINKTTETSSFNIAVPVIEQNTGKMIGILKGNIPLKNLNQLFRQSMERGIENYYLISSDGQIAASNQSQNLGKTLSKDFPNIYNQLRQSKAPTTGTLLESHNRQKALIAYTQPKELQEKYKLAWRLAVTQDKNKAFAAAQWLYLIPLLGIATAAGVALAAGILAEKVTRPIRAIASAVKKIGQGDLDTQVEVTGEDEFAVLGNNINAMTYQLKSLVQEQASSVQQANLLTDISSTMLADSFETEEALTPIFNKALDGLRLQLNCDRIVIYRLNSDQSGKIVYESLCGGVDSALKEALTDPCIPKELLAAYRQGRIQAMRDVAGAELHPEHLQLLTRLQVKANLVVPIVSQRELYGLLVVHYCQVPHQWTARELKFTQQIAEQLSINIDRLKIQMSRREDARRSQMLKDITLKIATALNSDGVFDMVVKELRKALNSDRAIVYRFNPKWGGQIIAESVNSQFPAAIGAKIDDPCFAERYVEKYRKGRVQATTDIKKAGLTECHLRQLEPFEVKANMVAPILHKGELLGLLVTHQCSAPRKWEQSEIDFFSQVATQVGLAIERTTLLEQQRQAEVEQRLAKEQMQKRALELLMEVDPVSRGDLTIRANVTEDEIGTIADSYNATIENLRKIVTQVQKAAKELASTTNDNQISVSALSEDASFQANNIASALGRIQLMTDSIQAVAANAEQAEVAVQQATQTVEAGEIAMNRTVDGIMAIRETVAETAKKVKRLGESSQKISKVVNLIGSFADQTNLLALNASIEAAHAGEEGRGFAVVADEVRSLARQSAQATAEIETLVASIQAETNDVVAAMESGTEQVVLGTKLVDETRKSLNQITAVSIQINELVEAIAKAAVEQSQTSQAVTQTMTQIATVSDKTSQEAAQVSDSFKKLLQVSLALQESVSQFKVTE